MTDINEDNIRVAAYYIWEQAGCPEGKDKDCWIKACEQVVKAGQKQKSAKSAEKAPAKKVETPKVAAKSAAKKEEKPAKPAVSAAPFYGLKKK